MSTDNTNVLLDKINKLENTLNLEISKRRALEEENKILKESKLVLLKKQLETQDNEIIKLLIDTLTLQKNSNIKPELNRMYFQEDTFNKSKAEVYKNKYDILKKEFDNILTEKDLEINILNNDIKNEKDKYNILNNKIEELNSSNIKLNEDCIKLSEHNNNLLLEICSLHDIIQNLKLNQENHDFEVEYLESEITHLDNQLNLKSDLLKKSEEEYNKINLIMREYQSKLIDMEVSNYLFTVLRIGTVVDTKADILLTKDSNHNYIIVINYMTSSITFDILEIKELKIVNEESGIFEIISNNEEKKLNERFKSKEFKTIINVFNEMKEKAYKSSTSKLNHVKYNDQKKKEYQKRVVETLNLFDF